MATKWRSATLFDLVALQRGFDITKAEQRDGPYPVVSSSGTNSYHDEFKVRGPGVVIGRKGTLGSVFYLEDGYWPHDTTLWVTDFHGNDPKFAYYVLKTMHLEQFDVGAANPTLNRNHIHGLPVRLPDVGTQRRIVNILAAYDDLIENNTKRIKILEGMARTLHREWFVNFRFPGVERLKMVSSPFGGVPEGWRRCLLQELVDAGSVDITTGPFGTQLHASDYVEWGTPVINVRNIGLGYIRREKLEFIEPKTVDRLRQHVLHTGDIVFGRKGAVERHVLVRRAQDGWFQGSDCLRLRARPDSGLHPVVLSQQFLTEEHKTWMKNQCSHGATMASLNQAIIGRLVVSVAPAGILSLVEQHMVAVDDLMERLREQANALRAARDLILPKLLSGEVAVGVDT